MTLMMTRITGTGPSLGGATIEPSPPLAPASEPPIPKESEPEHRDATGTTACLIRGLILTLISFYARHFSLHRSAEQEVHFSCWLDSRHILPCFRLAPPSWDSLQGLLLLLIRVRIKHYNLARVKEERDAYHPGWRGHSQDRRYALQSPIEDEDVDGDEFDDDCNMTFSSMDRDGYSRLLNGHYGSLQVSNGGGGSAVSSPAGESPEAAFAPTRFQVVNSGTYDSRHRKPLVRYHECQKNHAASMGGHAVDGCGEFLPGGKEGTLEALKCAACFCHRNFHRRECFTGDACSCSVSRSQAIVCATPYTHNPSMRPISPKVREVKGYQPPSSADISPHAHGIVPLTQFDDDQDDEDEPPQRSCPSSSKKKRFRTKFTPEQKERMFYFAETLGWRISKLDEDAVDSFCNDVGVKRNVFKVWMHNNKHNPRKRQ
ncbi:hypothetical protein L7F22_058332 [Adiantum nelumboides]|nr:hypothetical protein [Adiantum nelumboides]